MVKEAKNNCTEFAIRLNTFQLKSSIDMAKKPFQFLNTVRKVLEFVGSSNIKFKE